MNTIDVLVPPGIGDIHWSVQFVYPYALKYGLKVNWKVQDHAPLRSKPYLDLIPITNSVEYVRQNNPNWFDWKKGINEQITLNKLNPIMVNGWLEAGHRVEKCFLESDLVEEYELLVFDEARKQFEKFKRGLDKDYYVIFMSNKGNNGFINAVDYVKVCLEYKKELIPVLIGAEWDKDNLDIANSFLQQQGMKLNKDFYIFFKKSFDFIVEVIKHGRFLYGFQSGLHILADMMDVPIYMLYFPQLEKMLGSWMKKKNFEKSYEVIFPKYNSQHFYGYINKYILGL